MKRKHIFTFIFSLFFLAGNAQENPPKKKWKYEPNFMVGVDVLNIGISFFADRKLYQGFVSTKLKKNLYAVVDAGFEGNVYKKNGYNATANGPFIRLGAYTMMVQDPESELNGFYLGGKVAAAFYNQEYKAVPVRGYAGSNTKVAFPSSSQSSYWLEGTAGGRIRFFDSSFFIDVNIQPKYLIFSTKQDDIKPMIVPGFGKSSTRFNIGFSWNIAYQF